jgi:hypothetical protein
LRYRAGRELRDQERAKEREAEAELSQLYVAKHASKVTATSKDDKKAERDIRRTLGGAEEYHMPRYRVLPPISAESSLPQERWKKSWGHNKLCEISGLPCTSTLAHRRCAFCPVVVRIEYIPSQQLKRKRWVCPECVSDTKANFNIMERDRARTQLYLDRQRSAQKIQSRWRGRHERRRYQAGLRGIKRISAAARGKWSRRKFVADWKAQRRPFRVRLISASGLEASDTDGFSDPFAVVAVLDGTDFDNQIFRFDGKVVEDTLAPVFDDENFLVPGADGTVTITITLIDFDELRNDFLGQAVLRLAEEDFVGHKLQYELPLENMMVPVKESNRTAMRLGNSDGKGQGSIKFQLLPCSVATSFCGFMEEKANALSMASSKKWWVVFLDGYLRLYQFYGASYEKHCLNLRRAHGIVVYNKPVIDGTDKPPIAPHFVVRMPDRLWTLQSVALGKTKDVMRFSSEEHKHWRVVMTRTKDIPITIAEQKDVVRRPKKDTKPPKTKTPERYDELMEAGAALTSASQLLVLG